MMRASIRRPSMRRRSCLSVSFRFDFLLTRFRLSRGVRERHEGVASGRVR